MNIIFIDIYFTLISEGSLRRLDTKKIAILNEAAAKHDAYLVAMFDRSEPRKSMDFVSGWLYGSDFNGKLFGVTPDVSVPYSHNIGFGPHVISGTSIMIDSNMSNKEAAIYAWYITQHIPAKSFGNLVIVSNGKRLGSLQKRQCEFSKTKIFSLLRKSSSYEHGLIDSVRTEPFQL